MNRGFTLLEVLVAISILGLGLTAILSAQTGLFASSSYAERVSFAVGLARCKTSEVEIKLQKDNYYPLVDMKDEGPCCAEESYGGFRCKWKIEKVELPLPPTNTDLNSKISGGLGTSSSFGPLGAIAAVGASSGAVLGENPGLGDLSKLLAGGSAPGLPGGGLGSLPGGISPGLAMGGTQVLAPLVMSLVYPTLKPMLEASIRKLTVSVTWKEGSRTRDLTVTEFVTNPQQGGLNPLLPMGGLLDPSGAGTGLPGQGTPGLPGASPSPLGTGSPLGGMGLGL